MKSFLSRIKGKMAANFGGRYLGEILAEVIREEPLLASILWGKTFKKQFFVETEYDYLDTQEKRYADLALIDKISGKPLAVAEIKYEDESSEFTLKQLEDYLRKTDKSEIYFSYLTKNFLPTEQEILIEGRDCHLLYSEFGERLEEWLKDKPNSHYGKMLVNFLRDEGIMWNEEFSEKAVKLLIIKANRFPHKAGHGRLVSEERMIDDIPTVFSNAMNNMALLGKSLHEEIDKKRTFIPTAPSIDFAFDPVYSKKLLKKLVDGGPFDDDDLLVNRWGNAVTGGEFWTGANFSIDRNSMGSNSWCYVLVKLSFLLTKGKGEPLSAKIGSVVYGSNFENEWFEEFEIEISPDKKSGKFKLNKKKLTALAIQSIANSIDLCLKSDSGVSEDLRKLLLGGINGCNTKLSY